MKLSLLFLIQFGLALTQAQTVSGPVTINGSITINQPTIRLVNHTSGCSATTFTTSPGIDNTGANSLYCQVTSSSATAAVTDSSSNTWPCLTSATNATSGAVTRLCYVTNATVSASQTFTATAAGAKPSMICGSFSGTLAAASFDQQNQANNGAGSTIDVGPVTPGVNGELILAGVGFDASLLFASIGNSFLLVDQQNFGACFGSSMAYLVQGTAASITPRWTMNIANNNQAKIATFK